MSPRKLILSRSLAAALLAASQGCQQSTAPEPTAAKEAPVNHPETPSPDSQHPHTNRLANEPSPYLRQHMHNPVDWYPWGEEAFAKARKENKPILLSIGYSTCHWCHVMERESFENEAIAKVLNEHFVCIKVDREERPDIDKIYMTFVQATTGGGGWPLNVFLTPDRKPFFGGTYFPADPKYGRQTTFPNLLQQIVGVWNDPEKRERLIAGSLEQFKQLQDYTSTGKTEGLKLTDSVLTNALARFKTMYEPRHGGFSQQPKFPRPALPRFVLAQGIRRQDRAAIDMVLHTCEAMAAGGIHDQLAGGFARYSVDAQWLVPHFEKMLYDNAQLVQLYLDAWLVSGKAVHADTTRGILRYVLRDMTHPDGGFFSAEDADSEGHEGKFYCWTEAQLKEALTEAEFAVVKRHYGVTAEGNFEDHSHPEPIKHLNVLSIVDPKLNEEEAKLLAGAKKKLFDLRAKRVRPGLDDKVLASWNGLMLGAMARAAIVLDEAEYLTAAEKNLRFIQNKLWDAKSGTLYHRWRDGQRDDVQLLDAYSSMLDGTLHLYEATLKPAHLQFAIDLADAMIARFHDGENGGFFQSAGDDSLLLRLKEDYDGAEPSGNSVAALALLKLGKITGREEFTKAATGTLELFARNLSDQPQSVPHMLHGLDYLLREPNRLVVAGDTGSATARALMAAAHRVFQPNKVVLGTTGPVEEFAKTLKSDTGATAYVCSGDFCYPPTEDPAKVGELMKRDKTKN